MTYGKVDKKASPYRDGGPWSSGDLGLRQRVCHLVRRGCHARDGDPLAKYKSLNQAATAFNDFPDAPKRQTFYDLAGSALHPYAENTPSGGHLRFLCEHFSTSAEWLFTGTGPKERVAVASGATLSVKDLESELASHLIGFLAKHPEVTAGWLESAKYVVSGADCLHLAELRALDAYRAAQREDAQRQPLNTVKTVAFDLFEGVPGIDRKDMARALLNAVGAISRHSGDRDSTKPISRVSDELAEFASTWTGKPLPRERVQSDATTVRVVPPELFAKYLTRKGLKMLAQSGTGPLDSPVQGHDEQRPMRARRRTGRTPRDSS